ncbi:uncharacterized protein VTP21DRAFT_4058 [Calcarisporiella thermophila]|uniref:uncharacterized protein n=1 Tax=Calcarisporiella thermophila TaxID=911321 RepID=UPI003741EA4B
MNVDKTGMLSKEEAEAEKLVSAIEAREAGVYDLKESARHLFPEDSTFSLLSSRLAKRLIHKKPPPRGRLPPKSKAGELLNGLGPRKIDPKDLAVTLVDTIYLILHMAAKIKVERRSRIAKETKLLHGIARGAKFTYGRAQEPTFLERVLLARLLNSKERQYSSTKHTDQEPQSRSNYKGRRQCNSGTQGIGSQGLRNPRNQRYDNNSITNYNNTPSNPTNTSSTQTIPGN